MERGTLILKVFYYLSQTSILNGGITDLLKPKGFGQSLLDLRHTLLVLIDVGGEDDEGQAF